MEEDEAIQAIVEVLKQQPEPVPPRFVADTIYKTNHDLRTDLWVYPTCMFFYLLMDYGILDRIPLPNCNPTQVRYGYFLKSKGLIK